MANKHCNVAYDQIPHIVTNHPETTPDHWAIMICLFKLMKDTAKPIIYSNAKLSENCRLPLRTIERRIPELCKMGFISCSGRGLQRRISMGVLFSTTAILAVRDSTTAKNKPTTAKSDSHNRHSGGDYKHYTNHSSKEFSPHSNPQPQIPTVFEQQEFAAGKAGYEWVGEWARSNGYS